MSKHFNSGFIWNLVETLDLVPNWDTDEIIEDIVRKKFCQFEFKNLHSLSFQFREPFPSAFGDGSAQQEQPERRAPRPMYDFEDPTASAALSRLFSRLRDVKISIDADQNIEALASSFNVNLLESLSLSFRTLGEHGKFMEVLKSKGPLSSLQRLRIKLDRTPKQGTTTFLDLAAPRLERLEHSEALSRENLSLFPSLKFFQVPIKSEAMEPLFNSPPLSGLPAVLAEKFGLTHSSIRLEVPGKVYSFTVQPLWALFFSLRLGTPDDCERLAVESVKFDSVESTFGSLIYFLDALFDATEPQEEWIKVLDKLVLRFLPDSSRPELSDANILVVLALLASYYMSILVDSVKADFWFEKFTQWSSLCAASESLLESISREEEDQFDRARVTYIRFTAPVLQRCLETPNHPMQEVLVIYFASYMTRAKPTWFTNSFPEILKLVVEHPSFPARKLESRHHETSSLSVGSFLLHYWVAYCASSGELDWEAVLPLLRLADKHRLRGVYRFGYGVEVMRREDDSPEITEAKELCPRLFAIFEFNLVQLMGYFGEKRSWADFFRVCKIHRDAFPESEKYPPQFPVFTSPQYVERLKPGYAISLTWDLCGGTIQREADYADEMIIQTFSHTIGKLDLLPEWVHTRDSEIVGSFFSKFDGQAIFDRVEQRIASAEEPQKQDLLKIVAKFCGIGRVGEETTPLAKIKELALAPGGFNFQAAFEIVQSASDAQVKEKFDDKRIVDVAFQTHQSPESLASSTQWDSLVASPGFESFAKPLMENVLLRGSPIEMEAKVKLLNIASRLGVSPQAFEALIKQSCLPRGSSFDADDYWLECLFFAGNQFSGAEQRLEYLEMLAKNETTVDFQIIRYSLSDNRFLPGLVKNRSLVAGWFERIQRNWFAISMELLSRPYCFSYHSF